MMGDKLTATQKTILKEGNTPAGVDAYMQRRRSVEALAKRGLLTKNGLMNYRTTAAGRRAIGLPRNLGGSLAESADLP